MKAKRHRILAATMILAWIALAAGSAPARAFQAEPTPTAQTIPAGPVVARVYYPDRAALEMLGPMLDTWEVQPGLGYLVALLTPQEYASLVSQGYRVEIDDKRTALVSEPRQPSPGQVNGIPGYACYRTVEETYTSLLALALSHPGLATWQDIGDSWEKATPGGPAGYDLNVLVLTNQSIPGPKPKFFLMGAIHAREYTSAETAARFAEFLVNNYGIDPDVTWLLDYSEIHIVAMTNPDGRKHAETGDLWRKNTDNDDGCAFSGSWGTDLNRNSSFHWGETGLSIEPCSETYRGPSAASEPETQAIQNYVAGIFPDQRGPAINDPAPLTAMGTFITLHSYSRLVLWPWGDVSTPAPNASQLQTLGRKFAYFNHYTPEQSEVLYPTRGTTDDWAYGELGLAAYTFELGNDFFEGCGYFETTLYPDNLQALLYAAKSAQQPYTLAAGPDTLSPAVAPAGASAGEPVQITATLNDTRYSGGPEATQNIAQAAYYIDTPPWAAASPVAYTMAAADGAFDEKIEPVRAILDTSRLSAGRHTILIRGRDARGKWGPLSAAFVYILDPDASPVIQGYVRAAADNAPLPAVVAAGAFKTTADPSTGFYSLRVISDTYALRASLDPYAPATVTAVPARDYQVLRQDLTLYPYCSLLNNDVEGGEAGWTAQYPWAISTDSAHSPTQAWSDSPGVNYGNNLNLSLTSPTLDFSGFQGASLSFWHKYATEAGNDFANVEVSQDGGLSWSTERTFDGSGSLWRQESIPLAALDGQAAAQIRFRLTTDANTTYDGWHLDDFQVRGGGPACVTPLAPTAEFSSNSPVNPGSPAAFSDRTAGSTPLTYRWDFGDGAGGSDDSNPVYTYATTGTFTVTLTVTNTAGASSVSHPVEVRLLDLKPILLVELTRATTETLYAGSPALLSADLSPDDAAKPYSYTLDYGDSTQPVTATSSADPLSLLHTFDAAGEYTAQIKAWNSVMTVPVTASFQMPVLPVLHPITQVDLSVATTGTLYAGDVISFTADLFPDDAGMPFTYTIDFGDDTQPAPVTSSTNPLPLEHLYTSPGEYTATIGVRNADMAEPVSGSITVAIQAAVQDRQVYIPLIVQE